MTSRKRKTMTVQLDCKTRDKRRADYASILNEPIPPRLKRLIAPHRANDDGCGIAVVYGAERAQARIALGEEWQVQASDDLLRSLREEFGGCVTLAYP